MEKLKSLLLRVPDSYYDFVISLLSEARGSDQVKEKLTDFLIANPDATTSDVLYFVARDLGFAQKAEQVVSA